MRSELSPGAAFGQYHVEALIGEGGMGQVYRATDTRLRRTVALKVLTPALALDAELGRRLEREAHVLASLNHPNIAAIHGLEESGGRRALVLEFVEGPTLAERLARGAVPVAEALALARQITSALEAAHDRGIVHRDLKPSNIKVTPAGMLKVLDFGIARVAAESSDPASTGAETRTGLVLGTPAYMSPEQARGLAVDKRTDIWAFGCVLFEMLTGHGAFTASTASDSLARVLERDPDWSSLPAATPGPIRRLLARCLRKDAADRLHDIADARLELVDVLAAPAGSDTPPTAPNARVAWWWKGLALGSVALAAALLIWRPTSAPSSASGLPAVEFGVTFPNNFIPAFGQAVSPNGRLIAASVIAAAPGIWMHSIEHAQTVPLQGGEGGTFPFWSPDSSTIAFFQGNRLVTVRATGGPVTFVTDASPPGFGGSWSASGVIVFAADGKLFRVPAAGGSPVELALTGFTGRPVGPTFLPDGRHFIFCARRRSGGTLELASIDDSRAIALGDSECPGGFAPPDQVLFLRGATLMAQRIDLRQFALLGEARVVAEGVTRGAVGDLVSLTASASENGILAFPASRGGSIGHLVWFNRAGKITGAIDSPASDVEYLNPAISPDGATVAANRMDPQTGGWHVWLMDTTRGNAASRLTSDVASDFDPVWSPDGREIAYVSDRSSAVGFYAQPIQGGPARLLLDVSHDQFAIPNGWSKSPDALFFHRSTTGGAGSSGVSAWRVQTATRGEPIQLVPDHPNVYGARLSPDGRWLAYSSSTTGQLQVFVERFPTGSPRKQVSTVGGIHPRWTRDGEELVYCAPPGGVFANDLALNDVDIRVGPTRTLVDQAVLSLIDARTHYDVTRDGERILVRLPAGPPTPGLRVIVNWLARVQ